MLGALLKCLNLSGRHAMSRQFIDLLRERTGTAALEFALVAPVLFMTVFGTFQFGITLNNYVILTSATQSAARQLALSRGGATPWTDAVNQLKASAANLTGSLITPTVTINGGILPCTNDATCQTAMATAQGQPAMLTASYPCNLVIYGHDYLPGCTLTSQTTERIE
jgi:Flp pilus assembly protein TadG